MVKVFVLRLGHRASRDKRASMHVALVSRAFGAAGLYYSGQHDSEFEERIEKAVSNWGGLFKVEHVKSWRSFIKSWKGEKVHLTMYGLPFQNNLSKLNSKNKLIIVGGQKVPWEVYDLADYNLAVTNQPHSEIAALGVFLNKYFKGKELNKKFTGAKQIIKPQAKGKKVIKNES